MTRTPVSAADFDTPQTAPQPRRSVGVRGGKPISQCPHCNGQGTEADYIGLEMDCVEIECPACYGTGLHNKLND